MKISKNVKIIFCVSLVVIMALSTTVVVLAMNNKPWYQKGETDAYTFPITPTGTPEKWKEFNSNQEMLDACQIPNEKLKSISTKGLLETCLSYPMMGNIMLHNSTYAGFMQQKDNFNGLKELFIRDDVKNIILDFYYDISLTDILKTDDFPTFRLRYLEYIISQPEILNGLNQDESKKLVDYSVELIELKLKKHPETFSIMPNILIIGRILAEDENYQDLMKNEAIICFLETGGGFTDEVWQLIIDFIKLEVK